MSKTALVIDDEPDIRELLSMTLEQMGLSVTTSAGINKAKKQLAANRFDLCLTDMKLPDGDGLELVEHIQLHCPEMPVAVITAHGNMEIAVDALKKGAFDFVSKPLELMRLRNMVQTALDLSKEQELLACTNESTGLIGNSQAMQDLQKNSASSPQPGTYLYQWRIRQWQGASSQINSLSWPQKQRPFCTG